MLGRIAQRIKHTTFTNQVSKHQKADQRYRCRGNDASHNSYHNGEKDAGCLADFHLLIRHTNQPFLTGGQRLNDRRLNDGHQCHIRIGCHHNSSLIFGVQHLRNKDRGWPICRTNDRNRSRIVGSKEHRRCTERKKNAKLGGCSKNHQLWIT